MRYLPEGCQTAEIPGPRSIGGVSPRTSTIWITDRLPNPVAIAAYRPEESNPPRKSLPLASRSIVSGLTLMWARGMSEFGAVMFIAYQPMVTPVLIWERFGAFGLSYARPVAVLFLMVCLVLFTILRTLAWRKPNA